MFQHGVSKPVEHPDKFAANARDPQVKMIELKLSQGAKPGHGGMLPGPKVTPEIAEAGEAHQELRGKTEELREYLKSTDA